MYSQQLTQLANGAVHQIKPSEEIQIEEELLGVSVQISRDATKWHKLKAEGPVARQRLYLVSPDATEVISYSVAVTNSLTHFVFFSVIK